jgi:hypothetical protein
VTKPGDSIRPTVTVEVPENHLRAVLAGFDITEAVAVVGNRGHTKSIAGGESGKNLIGVYDDPICIITPDKILTYPGNTDPSRTIPGRAILTAPQKIRYTRGIHGITGPKEKQRPAWIQASGVTIQRFQEDGTLGPVLKNQWIGCNIHDGGLGTTGSAACQTVVPERWKEFDKTLDDALRAAAQTQFWYVLTI